MQKTTETVTVISRRSRSLPAAAYGTTEVGDDDRVATILAVSLLAALILREQITPTTKNVTLTNNKDTHSQNSCTEEIVIDLWTKSRNASNSSEMQT